MIPGIARYTRAAPYWKDKQQIHSAAHMKQGIMIVILPHDLQNFQAIHTPLRLLVVDYIQYDTLCVPDLEYML